MKKILILILALIFLVPAALAEDLSSLSDDELLNLQRQVEDELIRRNLYPLSDVLVDSANDELFERLYSFLSFWVASDYPNMLDYCASDWKDQTEDPQTELLRILANRTPSHYENVALSGRPENTERTAIITLTIDRHNGHVLQDYLYQITMKRESDGLWYVDPRSLLPNEQDDVTPELTAVPSSADADDILLYFNAESGQKYHLDPNCKTVHPNYLPLTDSFPFAEVSDPKYADLQPCEICGAPERPETVSSAE